MAGVMIDFKKHDDGEIKRRLGEYCLLSEDVRRGGFVFVINGGSCALGVVMDSGVLACNDGRPLNGEVYSSDVGLCTMGLLLDMLKKEDDAAAMVKTER